MKSRRLQKSTITAATLLTAVLWVGQVEPISASRALFNCAPTTKTKIVVVDTTAATASATLVNMPGSFATIDQSADGCVIVQFTASAVAQGATPMYVQAFIDDAVTNFTSPTWNFTVSDSFQIAHTVTSFFPNVAAGSHTIRMKYGSNGSDEVLMNHRILLIHYR